MHQRPPRHPDNPALWERDRDLGCLQYEYIVIDMKTYPQLFSMWYSPPVGAGCGSGTLTGGTDWPALHPPSQLSPHSENG